jgi:hypothetical protein
MSEQQMDQEEFGRQLFWDRLAKTAPKTHAAALLFERLFNVVWKDIAVDIGQAEDIVVSVGADAKIRTSLAGWLALGAVAIAAYNMARKDLNESKAELEKKIADLEEKVFRLLTSSGGEDE